MVTHEIPVDQRLAKELAKLAKRTGRLPAAIASDALRTYLDYTRRLLDDIDAGKRDAAAGNIRTADEVNARLAEQRARRKRKAAR